MIVKNESKIIERLLTSVLPIIDTYCICDTGSTDDTVNIITTFFKTRNISGKIVHEPFRDFGYNRTFALKQCKDVPNADYILLMDADMILELSPSFSVAEFKQSLKLEAYYVFQGSHSFFYKNIRIVKNMENVSYWGVTHEYVNLPNGSNTTEIERTQLFINDIGDGGAKTDKFLRDIRLLTQGLIDEPNNDRYTFYLANSYRDSGQYQQAIDTYKKRVLLGGWREEVWMSYYSIGNCYKQLNDMPNAIFYWLEGYQFYQDRIENLYEIIQYYRLKGQNTLAYKFYEIADYHRKNTHSTDHLFYQKDVYDYKLDYEYTIIGYYCNIPKVDMITSSMKILNHLHAEEYVTRSVMKNCKFYVQQLSAHSVNTPFLNKLNTLHVGTKVSSEFISSTPSICLHNNQVYINTRFVNYRITKQGTYIYNNLVTTKNVITVLDTREPEWTKTDEFVLNYNDVYDDIYVGVEDIRLLMHDDKINYSANRGLSYDNITIETGTIDLTNHITHSKLAIKDNIKQFEKNWVLFSVNSQLKVIYKWYPLTIGDYVANPDNENPTIKFVTTNTIETPPIFKLLRGSTNGVIIGEDIWFITHLVSNEDRRYYYHMFVILNKNTYEVKKYSTIFSFEKEIIEYTLGFIYLKESNQFVIGYSTTDSTTKFIAVDKTNIDALLM
jgi:tetratricopeptide (TPR) repeat protein